MVGVLYFIKNITLNCCIILRSCKKYLFIWVGLNIFASVNHTNKMKLTHLLTQTESTCTYQQGSTKMVYQVIQTESSRKLGSFISHECSGIDLDVPERFYQIIEWAMTELIEETEADYLPEPFNEADYPEFDIAPY